MILRYTQLSVISIEVTANPKPPSSDTKKSYVKIRRPRIETVEHHTTSIQHPIRYPVLTLFGNVLSNMTETTQVQYLVNQIIFQSSKKNIMVNFVKFSRQVQKDQYYGNTLEDNEVLTTFAMGHSLTNHLTMSWQINIVISS